MSQAGFRLAESAQALLQNSTALGGTCIRFSAFIKPQRMPLTIRPQTIVTYPRRFYVLSNHLSYQFAWFIPQQRTDARGN